MKAIPHSLRPALIRMAALVTAIGLALAAIRYTPLSQYFERDRLQAAAQALRELPGSTFLLTAAITVLASLGVPITALMLVAGAVLGGYRAFFVSWAAVALAAAVLFGAGHKLAKPMVQHLLGKRRARFERALRRRGFWPLIVLRYVPIPFSICNLAVGSSGVPAPLAILSSTLGYAPVVAVWTFLATALVSHDPDQRGDAIRLALAASVIVGLLSATPVYFARRARRRKLSNLRDHRRARDERPSE